MHRPIHGELQINRTKIFSKEVDHFAKFYTFSIFFLSLLSHNYVRGVNTVEGVTSHRSVSCEKGIIRIFSRKYVKFTEDCFTEDTSVTYDWYFRYIRISLEKIQ